MGYRVFKDSTGTDWQAWDVVPEHAEKRTLERRLRPVPFEHPDRRAAQDRRLIGGPRARMGSGLDTGWLCFDCETEKRRLAPIPGDWQGCPDHQLEKYCAEARPAVRSTGLQDSMM